MAGITNQRLKEMEEEMNRFEHEISMPVNSGDRNSNVMGNSTTQFVPHQLVRAPMTHHTSGMENSNMYASEHTSNMISFGQSNTQDFNYSIATPAVYSARPVKTHQPSNHGVVYTVPASPPPLAPPPPPPMAINYLQHGGPSQTSSDTSKSSSQGDHYSSSSMNSKMREQQESNEPTTPPVYAPSVTLTSAHMANMNRKPSKKKKIVRVAGNQVWEDNSLLEWDPDDFRIFCGDLGNDVTDEVLVRTFGRYPSFVKAKVVRDKRTNKTKGFGFVSFKDPQDFIKAMREMNGKYVGSRPIKLRKSTWKDRNIEIVKKKQKEKERLGLA